MKPRSGAPAPPDREPGQLRPLPARLPPLSIMPPGRPGGALILLDRAIALDPDYGPALALAAFCHVFLVASIWSDNPAAQLLAGAGAGLARAQGRIGRPRSAGQPGVRRPDLTAAVETHPVACTTAPWSSTPARRTRGSPAASRDRRFGGPGLGLEYQLEMGLRLDPLAHSGRIHLGTCRVSPAARRGACATPSPC